MTIHSKYVDPEWAYPYQCFSNDTSLSDAVTFTDGDYVDFTASLGRPAKNVQLMLNGTVDITIEFNTRLKVSKFNKSQADTTITMPEGNRRVNRLRLFSSSGESTSFSLPAEFPVDDIKIIDYTGTASASDNLTIIGF